jgi:Family of unknown function (DUF6152)
VKTWVMAAMLAGLALSGPAVSERAAAHHSFAVYFDDARPVTVEGVVTQFRFTNPHGLVVVDVTARDGTVHSWRAETNAPVVLQRRGWTRASVRPGMRVTMSGWQARDGSRYMRLRELRDANGRPIGSGEFGQNDG